MRHRLCSLHSPSSTSFSRFANIQIDNSSRFSIKNPLRNGKGSKIENRKPSTESRFPRTTRILTTKCCTYIIYIMLYTYRNTDIIYIFFRYSPCFCNKYYLPSLSTRKSQIFKISIFVFLRWCKRYVSLPTQRFHRRTK